MPAADRSVDIVAFLSEHLRDIVRRRVRELAGLALISLQLLGLAAVSLLAPEALLGWRLLTQRELGDKWRSLMWVLTTLLWAAFASTLPIIGSWPLPTGLGGV